VHGKHGFFNHQQGYEYNLTLAVVALTIAITGPGALSLDAALRLQDVGPVWGLAALVAGLIGGAIQLAGRRAPAAQKAS
jgi:putative oxidoreductase